MTWFRSSKPGPKGGAEKKSIHDGLWIKCDSCNQIIYKKELEKNLMVCPICEFHFRIDFNNYLNLLVEKDTFKPLYESITSQDPLNFPDYKKKLKESQKKTELNEAFVFGTAMIDSFNVIIGILDFRFMGGSMGSAVGEKVTLAIEKAKDDKTPLIIISQGGGGARMQEGILSLMQMAKTSSALALLQKEKVPFISILSNPTMGGVMASFASLGDITIAEPGALLGFAGPRVIRETIRQELPKGFQTTEFLLEHGMIDIVCSRKNLKQTIIKILNFFNN